jgi:hypothetical protein
MRPKMLLFPELLGFSLLALSALASTRACIGPNEAGKHVNKDVCIAAHVFDVVELKDGTRFLDVCSPETPDEKCRFTIVSLSADRADVGDLSRLKEREIEVRGMIRPANDRTELILSREQQFHGGGEKFRANPTLLKAFSAEGHATAFSDPALKSSHHRGALTRPAHAY